MLASILDLIHMRWRDLYLIHRSIMEHGRSKASCCNENETTMLPS